MPHTLINELVYDGCGKVFFGTTFVQIVEFSEDTNSALFLENENGIGHPCGVFDRIDETSLLEIINFGFDNFMLRRMDMPLFLVDGYGIRPSVYMMFNKGRIKSRHFRIRLGKKIT